MQQITTPAGQGLATVTEAQIVAAQLRLEADLAEKMNHQLPDQDDDPMEVFPNENHKSPAGNSLS